MVPDLVSDHIGGGEVAVGAELAFERGEEIGVEVGLLVDRAVEGTCRPARPAAGGLR